MYYFTPWINDFIQFYRPVCKVQIWAKTRTSFLPCLRVSAIKYIFKLSHLSTVLVFNLWKSGFINIISYVFRNGYQMYPVSSVNHIWASKKAQFVATRLQKNIFGKKWSSTFRMGILTNELCLPSKYFTKNYWKPFCSALLKRGFSVKSAFLFKFIIYTSTCFHQGIEVVQVKSVHCDPVSWASASFSCGCL